LKEVPALSLLLLLKVTALLIHKARIATATAASTVANTCRSSLLEPIAIAAAHCTPRALLDATAEAGAPRHATPHSTGGAAAETTSGATSGAESAAR